MDFNFEEEEAPPEQRKGPKKRFRKNKLKIVFDVDERKNFLLGFRKRKQERKEKYILKLERDLVKEKKRIKQQTERQSKKMSNSHAILPEVQSIIDNMPEKTETYDLGNTLVSITSLDDQIHRKLSVKKEETSDSEDSGMEEVRRKRKNADIFPNTTCDTDDEDGLVHSAKSDPFFNPINDDEIHRSEMSSEEEEKPAQHYNPLEMLRTQTATNDPEQKPISKAKLEREANRMLQESEVFKKMQRIKQKRSKKFRMFRLQPSEPKEGGQRSSGKSDAAGKLGKNKKKSNNPVKSKQGQKHSKRK